MKQARKVALINIADYPRDKYRAYWTYGRDGNDEDGYRWWAEIHSYAPVGWTHKGKTTKERPDVPEPKYPRDLPMGSSAIEQDVRRARCAQIHAAAPQPVHKIESETGTADTLDEADTAAQTWVLKNMKSYKRTEPPADKQAGYATAGLLLSPLDAIAELLLWLARPLLALAFSTTVRNERVQRIQVNIDLGAGAGLFRIYDGARPASCGTATTLLAELTFSDPCAPSASGGVLTMSAITADASANATGTATWFRNVDSTGLCVLDGNVGTSGSDLNLNSTSIATGQNVAVTSYTITDGNA